MYCDYFKILTVFAVKTALHCTALQCHVNVTFLNVLIFFRLQKSQAMPQVLQLFL